jgi:hypothetical protein
MVASRLDSGGSAGKNGSIPFRSGGIQYWPAVVRRLSTIEISDRCVS